MWLGACAFFFFFETSSHSVAQANLQPSIWSRLSSNLGQLYLGSLGIGITRHFCWPLFCFSFCFVFLRQGLMQPRLASNWLCSQIWLRTPDSLLPLPPKCWGYRCAPHNTEYGTRAILQVKESCMEPGHIAKGAYGTLSTWALNAGKIETM